MKTLVETSLFNLFASYTNGAGPALGELPAAYDDFVNCLATLSPAGDLTGQLRCLNYTKIELAFMRQACNGMAEDCRNILYDVFIDKTLALLDAEAEILKEMLRHGTVCNMEIEVRIMLGLFRNGKHWKRGIFWITVIFI